MTKLNAEDFEEFFFTAWGNRPFAWQRDLAERVLEREDFHVGNHSLTSSNKDRMESCWPEAIALPTASGKTACIDIAVFALAAQSSRLSRREIITAPRRVFFVVDRRVIVDEAYERARQLDKKLKNAKNGALKKVADNLRQIACGETTGFESERPLASYILRGGIYRSEAWARNPLQPTVTTSTVDQIGSRILFRAYGRGHRTWPIYAGLIANDSLILLDEAHCAQPFLQTLQAVQHFQSCGKRSLNRSFHLAVMSATPPSQINDLFSDQSREPRDLKHPLGMRQLARKPAILKKIEKAKGSRATNELSNALVSSALQLHNEQLRTVVIFVNRVATARETYRLLNNREDVNAVLLTGRMRSIDKDAVVQQNLKPLLRSGQSDRPTLAKPLIVVTTQTLEVGADLDFDGLVTECASLDALRQRFGRLNRMGRAIESRAIILVRGDQADTAKEEDPIYGQALTKTWNWLNKNKNKNEEIDFGIAHLDPVLPRGNSIAELNAPTLDAPVMLPAHIDCWTQTAPEPCPSPDIAPFLHGPREGSADVQVCWRSDLDLLNEKEVALELLRLCPPSSNETLPVTIGTFKRWLDGEEKADDSGDVEGIKEEIADRSERTSPSAKRRIIRWRGTETELKNITSDSAEIRPGDVIVIPANHPGLYSQIGDIPLEPAEPITTLDMADRAYRLSRAKPILRLHPKLIEAWPVSATAKTLAGELLDDLRQKYDNDPDGVTNSLRNLLNELVNLPQSLPKCWSWLPKAANELSKEYSDSKLHNAYHLVGDKSLILIGRRRLPELAYEADNLGDETDSSMSSTSHSNGRPVTLRNHLQGVEKFARHHASGCGLSNDLVDAIASAGLLHDLGKVDPRFQSLLRGGAPWLSKEFLAKSTRMLKTSAVRKRAYRDSKYPKEGRHELLSVRLAESAPNLLPNKDILRDLTLHLIASHHGYCRPFAPVVFDEENKQVNFELNGHSTSWSGPSNLECLDSGITDRYWKLVRHYGWWGLAWLEALLRIADWRQSEMEETHG